MVMHGLRQARADREPLGRYDRWVRDWERDGVIPLETRRSVADHFLSPR
jgi:hypothetical protein